MTTTSEPSALHLVPQERLRYSGPDRDITLRLSELQDIRDQLHKVQGSGQGEVDLRLRRLYRQVADLYRRLAAMTAHQMAAQSAGPPGKQ